MTHRRDSFFMVDLMIRMAKRELRCLRGDNKDYDGSQGCDDSKTTETVFRRYGGSIMAHRARVASRGPRWLTDERVAYDSANT
jgi:hypothetical protein